MRTKCSIVIGYHLNTDTAHSILEKGPNADNPEVIKLFVLLYHFVKICISIFLYYVDQKHSVLNLHTLSVVWHTRVKLRAPFVL